MSIYPNALLKKTTVITNVGEERFSSTGSVVISAGWMEVDSKPDDKILPDLAIGQTVSGEYSLLAKETEPPKRYTDKTLVASMISAGKNLDDVELRKIMTEGGKGIGTEATRASIIETLIERSYAKREGKSIVPTERGISFIQALPLKEIKSAELTAMWEERLDNIAAGKEQIDIFIADIEKATERWCMDINSAAKENSFASLSEIDIKCPGCGNPITKHSWGYGCSNYKNGCKFAINNTIASKKLSDQQVMRLITEGNTGEKPLAGFVSRSGKKFEAILVLNISIQNELIAECNVSFIFPNTLDACNKSQNTQPEIQCPACGAKVISGKWRWECEKNCGFALNYKIAGKPIQEKELRSLIKDGCTNKLAGFTSKDGKKFAAALRLKPDRKSVEFSFDSGTKKKQ